MNFLRFWKIVRPSLMPFTIETKLSSIKIISAASLETSVPITPIATPMSALFSAGASFTPSPVIAMTCLLFLRIVAILSFCSGAIRANTTSLLFIFLYISTSFSLLRFLPLITSNVSVAPMRPTFLAIARAVIS